MEEWLVETKKLIVDGPARQRLSTAMAGGVDILKKINELSVKVESQQKQIKELQKTVEGLRKH